VLSDKKQRKVYDELGWEGVQSMWQLGPHADYFKVEEILREREERLFENPKSRTVLKAHMDGTSWLDSGQVESWGDLVPEMGPLTLTQHFEQYFGDDVTGFLDVEMLNAHGRGTGSVVGRIRTMLSTKSQIEFSAGVGSKKFVGYSWQYLVWPGTLLGFTMQGNYYGGVLRPSYQVAVNQSLSENSRISLVAAQGGIFAAEVAAGPFNLNVQLMPGNTFLIRLKHSIELYALLSVKFKIESSSQEGVLASVGLVKQIPSLASKFGVHLQAGGYLGGVVLKIALSRFDYNFVFPVHLSHDVSLEALLLGSVLPSAASFLVNTCLLRPLRKRKEQKKWREVLYKQKYLFEEKKREAEMVKDLLKEIAERKKTEGLLIHSAVYRRIEDADVYLDVAIVLQALVQNSQLVLNVKNFYEIVGFYDIAPTLPKEVWVEYEFRGERHKVIVADGQPLCIPQKCHKISAV
jgi:DnaJ family protein C protein 11